MATPSSEPTGWLKEILDAHPANRGVLDDLIEDLKRSGGIPLVPFVGAGLSQALGLKGWDGFLLELDNATKPRIQELLNQGEYELAAQELEDALGRQAFHDSIRYEFGERKTTNLTLIGAVTLLPKLARGPVITTNFDGILKRVFEEAQRPFDRVVWGAQVVQITDAFRKNARYLLKLHGDAEESTDRILTRREYDLHYSAGGWKRRILDWVLRLFRVESLRSTSIASLLEGIYVSRILLFLGCSLNQDRTVQVLTTLASRQPGMHHYAVMPLGTTPNHHLTLSKAHIKVLWYPARDRHALLVPLLEHLIAHAPAAPGPQQPKLTLLPPTRGFETRAIQSDVDLLIPFRRTTAFLGRQPELDALWAWLHNDKPISIRLVTGRGGAGKTRIAIELMLRLEAERPSEWNAGWLSDAELRDFPQRQNLAAWQWPAPTLAVIDYASTSVELLRPWLRDLAAHPAPPMQRPLRILLLEREASRDAGWFESLLGQDWTHRPSVEALFDPCAPVRLVPIADLTDRRAILSAMLAAAALRHGLSPPPMPALGADKTFDQRLAGGTWLDPITLHMAALVAIDNGIPQALSLSRTDLAFHLADRELDRAARAQTSDPLRALLRHMAAFVTAAGGLARAKLLEAAKSESAELGADYPGGPAALVDGVCRALPAPNGAASILPDIVGEAALLRVFGGDHLDQGIAALCRAAHLAPAAVAASICRTTQNYAGREEPLSWLEALIREGLTQDFNLLAAVNDAMPRESTRLRVKAVEVIQLLLSRFASQSGEELPLIARLNSDLALRLRDVGRREEALGVAREGVEQYRQLAEANSDAFRPGLAMSLNNLANSLRDVGRREEALRVACEAVEHYRQLAEANPDAFRPDLAMSLNNLALGLSEVGRREEALGVARQAVEHYRRFAEANPDAFRPDLAMSLNNLANSLSEVGRREEALVVAREGVEQYRQLAEANPDAFRPGLAMSLNNLANMLSDVGRREEALEVACEAVEHYRQLAEANPDAFRADLARSINNLANRLSDVGRQEEALGVACEAVEHYRQLAKASPDAFCPYLAASLDNLAVSLSGVGRREEALEVAREAVEYYRQLAEANPDAFRPELAGSLNNLANRLSAVGRREEALGVAREAVEHYGQLAEANPDAFRPDLARSLNNLANSLRDVGRREEALRVAREAVELRCQLAEANPDAFRPDLARSLGVYSDCLQRLERHTEAVEAAREGIANLRDYFLQLPDAFRGLMTALLRDYLHSAEKARLDLDLELLAPILPHLQPPDAPGSEA